MPAGPLPLPSGTKRTPFPSSKKVAVHEPQYARLSRKRPNLAPHTLEQHRESYAQSPARFSNRSFHLLPSPVWAALGFRRRAVFGAKAVESRRTKLVRSMYSLPVGEGAFRRTSASSALNASRAISVCDIFTVVKGGITNCAKRMSSNPTTDSSFGTCTPCA